MKGAIICEESQAVTKAFRMRGHKFYSNDLQECSGGYPEWHVQDDCFKFLSEDSRSLYLQFLGAHPDCTYLTNAGVRWLASKIEREGYEWSDKYQIYVNPVRFKKMEQAAIFFKQVLKCIEQIGKGYVENPIMHKYAMEIIGRQPDQIIHPWMFGHLEQKATCMWYVNLPKLEETDNVYEDMMKLPYKERAKVHYEYPGLDRAKRRSKTYFGIAKAMAEQWG